MIHADLALARRVERAEAANALACVQAQAGSASFETSGGLAVFAGADSPLTQVVGIGLSGPVSSADLDRLEEFFHSRGARVNIDLCPLADSRLLDELAARGYRPGEFNSVLVRRLSGLEAAPPVRTRRITAEEGELWSRTVGEGFFETAELTAEEVDVGRAITVIPEVACYLALADGRPGAAAAMTVSDGLATLFADGTISRYRCQGLHRDLIAARLLDAQARSCEFATATTLPGGVSQRNYERAGFQVTYTKISFLL
jgi:hypothetical protein